MTSPASGSSMPHATISTTAQTPHKSACPPHQPRSTVSNIPRPSRSAPWPIGSSKIIFGSAFDVSTRPRSQGRPVVRGWAATTRRAGIRATRPRIARRARQIPCRGVVDARRETTFADPRGAFHNHSLRLPHNCQASAFTVYLRLAGLPGGARYSTTEC